MAIFNRYKDILVNFINNSDAKSPNRPGQINKGSQNVPRFKNSLTRFLERNRLDKDISDRLSLLMPKTRDFLVHHRHDIVIFGLKSGRS